MGASFSCCNNTSVQFASKVFKEIPEEDNSTYVKPKTFKVATKKQYTKKNSVYFDKSHFINMKTKSLFIDYEITCKLGEGICY